MFKSFLRVVELQGLQAAGKTTLTKAWLDRFPNVVRVNRDDLRAMLRGNAYTRGHEPVVVACEKACAEAAIREGYNVIVDDTNLTGDPLWKRLADALDVKYTSRRLNVSVEEAIQRDAQRPKPVGPVVIKATAKRMK